MAKVVLMLSKKLVLTAIVIVASVALMQINQALGLIFMMLYSSCLVISSARKDMVLTKLTALLPGAMSLVCFLVMFALLGVTNPVMVLAGCGAGMVFGFFMAKGHKVYTKDGVVYSRRTLLYILLWVCSVLLTQGSTLMGMREIVDFSLSLNGFSTAGMVVLSIFLWLSSGKRQLPVNTGITSCLFLFFLVFGTFSVPNILAITFNTTDQFLLTKQIGKYLFDDILPSNLNLRKDVKTYHKKGNKGVNNQVIWYGMKGEGNYKTSVDLSLYNYSLNSESLNKTAEVLSTQKCLEGDKLQWTTINGIKVKKCSYLNPKNNKARIYHKYLYKNWVVSISIDDYQGKVKNGKGITYGEPYQIADSALDISTRKLKAISSTNDSSDGSDTQSITSHDQNDDSGSSSNSSNSGNFSIDTEFSDEAAAAGFIAAIIQVLLGLGLSGANALTQTTASAAMAAAQEAVQDARENDPPEPPPSKNIIYSGTKALQWMEENKYTKNGEPTDKYWSFRDLLPTQTNPDLQGMAFEYGDEIDPEKDFPTGEFTIIVDGNSPLKTDETEQHVETEEITETEEPEEPEVEEEPEKTVGEEKQEEPEEDKRPFEVDGTEPAGNELDRKENTEKEPPEQSQPPQTEKGHDENDAEEEQPPEFPNAREDLEKVMEDVIGEKTAEGYYVTNPNLVEKAWNRTLGGVINWLAGYRGGSCGDFASGAEWDEKTEGGIKWSEDKIKDLFGEGAIVTDITCERQSNWLWIRNHAATRVILPNGDRYILDYWEGMQTKQPAVYSEDEWLSKWKDKLHDQNEVLDQLDEKGHVAGSPIAEFWEDVTNVESVCWEEVEVLRTTEERTLKNYMENWAGKKGEEFVKTEFYEETANKELAASIIKAWEKNPW